LLGFERYVSFDFVQEKLRASYSETGRPSIDPEVLLRILLLGYLYGITRERKLTGAVPQHESATSDGNRVRNRLPQEKHEPEETPLRENASSNRVFQHQRDISTVGWSTRGLHMVSPTLPLKPETISAEVTPKIHCASNLEICTIRSTFNTAPFV
jgi:Transposase domain (DUF772)